MVQYRARPCQRCGGSGGWVGWPGFTCFRCGGNGIDPKPEKVYTEEEREKLDAANQRRRDKKATELAAKQAETAEIFPDAIQVFEEYTLMIPTEYDNHTGRPPLPLFIGDIKYKYAAYGDLTPKQAQAVVKAWDEWKERCRKREEERAKLAPVENAQGATIEGVIIKTWEDDNSDFGRQLRMSVKTEGGNRLRGTIPQAIFDLSGLPYYKLEGSRVRFVADIIQNPKDNTTGYFKRPRKAEVLSTPETALEA